MSFSGIAIDNMPLGSGLKVYNALHLEEKHIPVNLSLNTANGTDAMIIGDMFSPDPDLLGYLAPGCTVDIFVNDEAADHFECPAPERITGVIRCKNPRCITAFEQELTPVFVLTDPHKKKYRCLYCEAEA